MQEILANNWAVAFPTFTRFFFDWEPTPKQIALGIGGLKLHEVNGRLEMAPGAVNDVLGMGAIRSGKTMGVAYAYLLLMWAFPRLELANFGPSVDQAATMYRAMLQACRGSKRFERYIKDVRKHPYPSITLSNESYIEARSVPMKASGDEAELIRSREYDCINVDEAFLFGEPAIQVLRGRLLGHRQDRPYMPARLGRFTMLSNPDDTTTWGRERYYAGLPGSPTYNPLYLSIHFRLPEDAPWLRPEDVEALRAKYTRRRAQMDLDGEFADPEDAVFPIGHLRRAFVESFDDTGIVADLQRRVEALADYDEGMESFHLEPEAGHYYVAGWDIGKGTSRKERGAAAGVVLDITNIPWLVVALEYLPCAGKWYETISQVRRIQEVYQAEVAVDSTGSGDVVEEWAESEGVDFDLPVRFSAPLKANIIYNAQWCLERGYVKGPYIKRFFDQLRDYVRDDERIPQDMVMAFAMALHAARERIFGGSTEAISVQQGPRERVRGARVAPRRRP